jgi:hypothetical protein
VADAVKAHQPLEVRQDRQAPAAPRSGDTLDDLPGSARVQQPVHHAGAVQAPRFTPGSSGRPHLDLAAIPL